MEYGLKVSGDSYFITCTLRKGKTVELRDATWVAGVWRRFWVQYRRAHPEWKKIAWFRVVELTKQGQPHLHLLVTGLGGISGGAGTKLIQKEWRERWLAATGDSYIVDVRPVRDARGMASYLCKYLVKGFSYRARMVKLGFMRRWSRSRTWPDGLLVPAGSKRGWKATGWMGNKGAVSAGARELVQASQGDPDLQLVPKDDTESWKARVAVAMSKRDRAGAAMSKARALLRKVEGYAKDSQQGVQSKQSDERYGQMYPGLAYTGG